MMQKYIFKICYMLLMAFGLNAQCDIIATSSGGNTAYTQVYVLVDAATNLIVAQNNTGTFSAVAPGSYQVHALNYDPANPPIPLPAALIGQDISLVGSTTAGCFNADFLTDYVNRACSSCQQSNTICETDPFTVSSSGGNNGYTQLYVLVDAATSLIVATSTSGDFTALVAAGNSYQVYALNYNPVDPPSPLPISGQSVNAIGTTTQGCYNSDYLTDYICYNVTSCTSSCFNNTSLCVGNNISVSTSGENLAYTQVFVLTDHLGNFIAENTTGTFASGGLNSGATYHVHALNFNPSDPPSPLPSVLAVGDPISGIGGGCYNADFLTDFLCFTFDCVLLNQELDRFEGEALNDHNLLQWTLASEEQLVEMELERSADGIEAFELISQQFADGSLTYQSKDLEPLKRSYYRLKLKYADGLSRYSDQIYIERSVPTATDFQVFPNPASEQAFIKFSSLMEGDFQLSVIDPLGRILIQQKINADQGVLQLDLSKLAAGSYTLSLSQDSWRVFKKIIKM